MEVKTVLVAAKDIAVATPRHAEMHMEMVLMS
jgi:hypothetical protein